MDDQPRYQHWSPWAASHHIIARRPPAPFAAHRARRQRQLKAHLPRPHPTKYNRIDDHPIIIGGGHRPQPSSTISHQAQIKGDRAIATSWTECSNSEAMKQLSDPEEAATTKFLATGQRFDRNIKGRLSAGRTITEFKGCQWHSSKGGS